jgi:4-amino-4-deoxy-L-arabinose transferase-like glycosyltransferase
MLLLAFFLRLGLGIALTYILPVAGYPTDVQQAGYVFKDAFIRDTQAWELACSTRPIWAAFDKSYSTDQYGGLLVLSALAYRYLSPDVHRPWLVILLSALTATVGVALTWKATRQLWGESLAVPAAWIMALYPESVLLGSSQMRESFLITFVAMTFWGVVDWRLSHNRRAWPWLAGGLAGLLLFSPGVAIFAILVLAGWMWLRGEHRRLSWRVILIGVGVLFAALLLLWVGLARGSFAGASPAEVITHWLQTSTKWDIYLLERGSGWVQEIFRHTDARLHLPFIIGYGLAQPVLPAAIFDVTAWPWQAIGILRALGWYALLPFLIISLIAIWKIPVKNERTAWFWLWLLTWIWIIISALRAGGDQWDNPRYRAILLLCQAALASKAWMWWRASKNPWPVRILIVEGVFLAFFTEWYASRYIGYIAKLPFATMLAVIGITSGFILAGGWVWDRRQASRRA